MPNIKIADLPAAGPITGTELVPIVQEGITVRATTAAVAGSPSQQQTFITVNQEPTLPNSRALSSSFGIGITDNGPLSSLSLSLQGAADSLNSAGTGFVVKTGSNTVTARNIAVSGSGLSISNGDGQSGNPDISLTGLPLLLAQASGTGLLAIRSGPTLTPVSIVGTSDQITVTDGSAASGSPTISLASNAIFPGTGAVTLPIGTTAQQPVGNNGQIRYNTDVGAFEGYTGGSWKTFSTAGGVTLVNTGTGLTGGPITSTGTISLANTAVTAGSYTYASITVDAQGRLTAASSGAAPGTVTSVSVVSANGFAGSVATSTTTPAITLSTTVTGIVKGNGTAISAAVSGTDYAPATSGTSILYGNGAGGFSNVTIGSGVSFAGGTLSATGTGGTVTSITAGTGLTGGTITSTGTIGIDNTVVATLSDTQTLTNKTISGSSNTLTNIGNGSLTNSAVTINGSTVSLGGSTTITATASNALTIGTGLSGTSYNGSTPVTIAIDSTVATLTGTQTLTNKTISGANNSLTNIGNSSLTNSSVTIGSTSVSLGGTTATLSGLTSITLTQDPVSDLQVATKQYVDSIASGLNYHQPVNYASTTALPSYTYNNGTSGVGATITANANGALSFGGGSPTAGQRLLVKDEAGANEPYNGIYTVTQAGNAGSPFILTRATDYDSSGTGTNEIDAGDYVLVLSGTNASTAWVQQTPLPITVGTTALVFLQFNAPITYTAGTGLNLSPATTFNISNTGVSAATYGSASSVPVIAVNAQGQITSASNSSIAINGNQITSGVVGTAYGGTALSSFTSGGALYATSTSALTSGTLPITAGGTGITAFGTGVQTALGQAVTGSGGVVLATSPTLTTPALGTPTSVVLTNATGLPIATGVSGLGTGVATALAVNVGTAGAFVVNGGALGTPSSGTLTNATGLPISSGVSGLGTGVATALAINVGSAGAFVVNGGALGTPSSGTVTNLTGTASININGTVGATTPTTGAFTTISASGVITSTVATGTAPFTVASTTQVANLNAATAGTATNANNVAIATNSANATNYLTFVSATTGNLPELVNSSITCNPSTGAITGGISGGTF